MREAMQRRHKVITAKHRTHGLMAVQHEEV
jgi:hypothetical protein